MRKTIFVLGLLAASAFPGYAADHEEGIKEEKRSCLPCHGLRIIHVQRLSRAAWERELEKMERWGAVIKSRPALLDYLADSFAPTTPAAAPVTSEDGRQKGSAPAGSETRGKK